MPPKKRKETAEEQNARFRAEVERMAADGELNPTEADKVIDEILAQNRRPSPGK